MKLFRTNRGFAVEHEGPVYQGEGIEWDTLLKQENPLEFLLEVLPHMEQIDEGQVTGNLRAPIGC